MAFVPELDDPKKDQDPNASDITAQASAPAPSAAPVTGGTAVGGNPAASASKSSGNFQDFSKFKAANQNKLSALSNLATDQATNSVNNAKSAFDNAGSAYQQDIAKNAKNFDTSGFKNVNVNSDIDATKLGKELSDASQVQDAGAYQGKLAGDASYTGLKSAEDQVSQLGTRAGTAGVLSQYGADKGDYSSSAAGQDALLLQSMNDYRQKANQISQNVKGTTDAALAANQAKIGQTATDVNSKNAAFKQQALDALKGVKTGIDTNLSERAAGQEAIRQQSVDAQVAKLNDALRARATAEAGTLGAAPTLVADEQKLKTASALGTTVNGYNYETAKAKLDADTIAYNAQKANASSLNGMNTDQLMQKYGGADLVNALRSGKVDANTVLGQDQQRQAQLAALEQLIGGDVGAKYNQGSIAPGTTASDLDNFINSIRAGTVARTPAQVVAPAPVAKVIKDAGTTTQTKTPQPAQILQAVEDDGSPKESTKGRGK